MSKKQQFTLEYPVRCSPSILFEFLSTPAGLQEWFADKVDERDNVFSFSWNGSIDKAEVTESEEDKYIQLSLAACTNRRISLNSASRNQK